MTKRASGEGSVFQTPNGRWVAILELPRHPNGKRNRKLRRARTRSEAQRKLREMRAEYDDHGQLPAVGRKMTESVADYVEHVRGPAHQTRKVRERDELFAEAVTGFFSHRSTSEVTVQDCDNFLASFIAGELTSPGKPVSRDYARRARAFLTAVFRNEMRQGRVNRNPAEVAVIPSVESSSRQRRALTASEWRQLFEQAEGVVKLSVDLGGRHGLRPQEVRGVRWSDIDFEVGTLSVVAQLDADDQFVCTKTEQSTRTLRLHPETLDLLRAHHEGQAVRRGKTGDDWIARDLVLTTRRGTAINNDNHRRSLTTLCAKVGIDPVTPYELRHTAITHQIEAGRSVSQVADWAGTSERMIYKHYRHKIREVIDLEPLDYE
ncbi:MAG: tyrosine-type recombinase/integrase [Acidimicrobiales bacterium]